MTVILSVDKKTLTIKSGTRFYYDRYSRTTECELLKDIVLTHNPLTGTASGQHRFLINGRNYSGEAEIDNAYKVLDTGSIENLYCGFNDYGVQNELNYNIVASGSGFWFAQDGEPYIAHGLKFNFAIDMWDYSPGDTFDLAEDSDIILETPPKPISNITIDSDNYYIKDTEARDLITTKQDLLVSGTNIKTINGEDVLGEGDLKLSTYHPPILSCMWSDHLINDIQWLRADTFSWQDGDVYVTAYNTLVNEYATGVEETEGSVTFRRSSNGFKIATSDMESAILNKYNTDGIAWYYILDTTNKRFKLPRTKWGFEGLRGNAGNDIAESLPNITGRINNTSPNGQVYRESGSLYWESKNYNYPSQLVNNTSYNYGNYIIFDASRSSSTYKDNAPVQERATQMYLYFYVGEYARDTIEQTAGITTEQLNNKVDIDSSWGFPSNRYIDLTLGASGSSYTAPANGWFSIAKRGSGNGQSLMLYLGETASSAQSRLFRQEFTTSALTTSVLGSFMPCKKGDKITIEYTIGGALQHFRFIYAEGSN